MDQNSPNWIVDNLKSLINQDLLNETLTDVEKSRTLDYDLNINMQLKHQLSPEEIKQHDHFYPCKLPQSNSSSSIMSLSNYLDDSYLNNNKKLNQSISGSSLIQKYTNESSDFIDYDLSSYNINQHETNQQQYLAVPSLLSLKSVNKSSTPSNQYKFLNTSNYYNDQENMFSSNNSINSIDFNFTQKKRSNLNLSFNKQNRYNPRITKSSSTLFQQQKQQQQQHQQQQQQQNCQFVSHSSSYDSIGSINNININNSAQLTPNNKECITLHVKNLDYKISSDEWKRILLENFRKHCKEIISVQVVTNLDKSLLGIVKLGSKDDARLAISSLHHKKIGYKRLNVNIAFSPSTSSPKSKIVALLKSNSDSEMLLTRFIELYEQRYNQTITISELFKLKDIVYITQSKDGQGRLIKLSCKNYQNNLENEMQELLHQPYCSLHCNNKELSYLPNVVVSLRQFKSAVHKLLNDHGGQMPLLSFMDCFKSCILNQSNPSNTNSESSLVIDNENGVPLEHLITCAQDVQIQYNEGFYKQLKWENDKSKSYQNKSRKLSDGDESDLFLVQDQMEESQRKLNQFSHEVVELFKSVARCVIPLSKFNNEYHKKYGRQCRVADYGYTKLYELLESIPHIVQIIDGEFEKKLTLTHRVQVRRFSNDLLKSLKSSLTQKQMFADEYPIVYEKHFNKQFDIRDYGVCYLEDMLAELPESILSRKEIDGKTFIQIPKIVQDDQEITCTLRLKQDIIDMLKLRPRFSIQFNKFIPNFHHHFGRQCKLSNYGYTKLIDLLESINDTVQIFQKDSVQFVQLSRSLMMDLISQNILKIIEENNFKLLKINFDKLEEFYNNKYEAIYYQDFESLYFKDLFKKLPLEKNFIKCEVLGEKHVNLYCEQLNEKEVKRLSKLILKKLMDDLELELIRIIKETSKGLKFFNMWDLLIKMNQDLFNLSFKIQNNRSFMQILKYLSDYFVYSNSDKLEPDSCIVGLSEFYYFSKQIRSLYKQLNMLDFSFIELENAYKQTYDFNGIPYKRFGFIDSNLIISQGLSLIVTVKKYQNDKRVCLNREFWPKTFLDTNNSNVLSDSFSSPVSPIGGSNGCSNKSNLVLTPSETDLQKRTVLSDYKLNF